MNRRAAAGFTYAELLVATVLIVVVLVPAIELLSTGTRATGIHESAARATAHLASRFEEILALPVSALDAEAQATGDPSVPTVYSDPPGTEHRVLVYLSRYDGDDADGDGDPLTGGDAGLVWLRLAVEGSALSMETLASD